MTETNPSAYPAKWTPLINGKDINDWRVGTAIFHRKEGAAIIIVGSCYLIHRGWSEKHKPKPPLGLPAPICLHNYLFYAVFTAATKFPRQLRSFWREIPEISLSYSACACLITIGWGAGCLTIGEAKAKTSPGKECRLMAIILGPATRHSTSFKDIQL